MTLTRADRDSWLETIWDALHSYREDSIPVGEEYDPIWDDICTAMAWIEEEISS
jgi:hypothetical protein